MRNGLYPSENTQPITGHVYRTAAIVALRDDELPAPHRSANSQEGLNRKDHNYWKIYILFVHTIVYRCQPGNRRRLQPMQLNQKEHRDSISHSP